MQPGRVAFVVAGIALAVGGVLWLALQDAGPHASAPADRPGRTHPGGRAGRPVGEATPPAGTPSAPDREAGAAPADAAGADEGEEARDLEAERIAGLKPRARPTTSADPPPTRSPDDSAALVRSLRVQAREEEQEEARARLLADALVVERELAPYVGELTRGETSAYDTPSPALWADAALEEPFRGAQHVPEIAFGEWRKREPLPEEVALRFPEGISEFHPTEVVSVAPPPRLVVVQGAGMDATALTVPEHWRADPKTRWVFRDLTFHCAGGEFVRSGESAIRLERVRVVGWGHDVFRHDGLLVARDCRFEMGFVVPSRKDPLFGSRDLSVRLDGCALVGPFRSPQLAPNGAAIVATDCRFESSGEGFESYFRDRMGWRESSSAKDRSVRFEDCVIVSVLDEDAPWPLRKLVDLNPAWIDKRW